jgi:hypothetical protein
MPTLNEQRNPKPFVISDGTTPHSVQKKFKYFSAGKTRCFPSDLDKSRLLTVWLLAQPGENLPKISGGEPDWLIRFRLASQ